LKRSHQFIHSGLDIIWGKTNWKT